MWLCISCWIPTIYLVEFGIQSLLSFLFDITLVGQGPREVMSQWFKFIHPYLQELTQYLMRAFHFLKRDIYRGQLEENQKDKKPIQKKSCIRRYVQGFAMYVQAWNKQIPPQFDKIFSTMTVAIWPSCFVIFYIDIRFFYYCWVVSEKIHNKCLDLYSDQDEAYTCYLQSDFNFG